MFYLHFILANQFNKAQMDLIFIYFFPENYYNKNKHMKKIFHGNVYIIFIDIDLIVKYILTIFP